jgi:hypothetical protein
MDGKWAISGLGLISIVFSGPQLGPGKPASGFLNKQAEK